MGGRSSRCIAYAAIRNDVRQLRAFPDSWLDDVTVQAVEQVAVETAPHRDADGRSEPHVPAMIVPR